MFRNMSITLLKPIGELKKFQPPRNNVDYPNLTPDDLELRLAEHGNGYFSIDMTLHFKEKLRFGVPRHSGGFIDLEETNKEDALKKYSLISEQIKNGDYKLHLYSDGHIEIEFTK